MTPRQMRGYMIVHRHLDGSRLEFGAREKRDDLFWAKTRSEQPTGNQSIKWYETTVDETGDGDCSCQDWEYRKKDYDEGAFAHPSWKPEPCKHMFAVALFGHYLRVWDESEEAPGGTSTDTPDKRREMMA